MKILDWFRFGLGVALLTLAGCSDTSTKNAVKEAETPDPPITGRQGFQRMYPAARAWAQDSTPLQLTSHNLAAVKSEGGKSGAWQCTFVSESTHRARMWTWSAVEAEGNLHKGVFESPVESWSGPSRSSQPFLVQAIRVDSDAAYETALKHVKKAPDKPVLFVLERNERFPDLSWRVVWGDSVSASELSVFVDATTGLYLETVH